MFVQSHWQGQHGTDKNRGRRYVNVHCSRVVAALVGMFHLVGGPDPVVHAHGVDRLCALLVVVIIIPLVVPVQVPVHLNVPVRIHARPCRLGPLFRQVTTMVRLGCEADDTTTTAAALGSPLMWTGWLL